MTSYTTFIKHAEKVTKSASKSRPILTGVHHAANGDVVVTDSHRLYYLTGGYTQGEPFTSVIKTGEHLDGNYPDVNRLIPEDGSAIVMLEIDVAKSLVAIKALQAAEKAINYNGKHLTLQIAVGTDSYVIKAGDDGSEFTGRYTLAPYDGDGLPNIHVQAQFLTDALTLFKDAGETTVTLRLYGNMRPLTFKSKDVTALLLPVRTY